MKAEGGGRKEEGRGRKDEGGGRRDSAVGNVQCKMLNVKLTAYCLLFFWGGQDGRESVRVFLDGLWLMLERCKR